MFWICLMAVACFNTSQPNHTESINTVIFEDEHAYVMVSSSNRLPYKKGQWENTPTVFVCNNAPITRTRAYQAVRFWERLGYEIDGPFMNSNLPVCLGEEDFSWGNIVIDLRGQDFPEDKIAVTKSFRRNSDDVIVGAVIEVQGNAASQDRTIEHEIGHALGWQHYNRKYHIMHSIHQEGGWDVHGLRSPRR